MFCQKCGNQLDDDEKFCHVCGYPSQAVQSSVPQQIQQTNSPKSETSVTASTDYANTSFKCALWGSVLILLCGIGLFAQPFALLFGVLALKNEEPEKTKAWMGAIIGAVGTVILIIIIYAIIFEDYKF